MAAAIKSLFSNPKLSVKIQIAMSVLAFIETTVQALSGETPELAISQLLQMHAK